LKKAMTDYEKDEKGFKSFKWFIIILL
jgi:hypothetical protein